MKSTWLIILLLFLFTQCRDEDHGLAEKQKKQNDSTIKAFSAAAVRGESVFTNKCTSCHCQIDSHCEQNYLPQFIAGATFQQLKAFILKPEIFKKENKDLYLIKHYYNGYVMPDQQFKDSAELSDLVVFLKVHYR